MKKTALILLFVLFVFSLQAQSYFDNALSLSENNYLGTARTMGMGNAVTAVGGDLGSLTLNPAGSAVAGYSQVTITPGLDIAVCPAAYAPVAGEPFSDVSRQSKVRFALHNAGFSLRLSPSSGGTLKSIHFSFLANGTNTYTKVFGVTGMNSKTSKFAEFAYNASGIPSSVLGSADIYSDPNYNSMWDVITAYRAGLINSYCGNMYAATSEYLVNDLSYRYVPGAMRQTNGVSSIGSKTDLLFNLGFNIDDRLYFGFNLGIPTAVISSSTIYREVTQNPEQFPVKFDDAKYSTYYTAGSYQYDYSARVDGVYGKFGFIFLPTSFLRLGAAIKTPTAFTISETWRHTASSSFTDSYWNVSASSLRGESRYALRSSYELNAGAALTFGRVGMLSFDYEMMDYSMVGYREIGSTFESESMYAINQTNRLFAGISHAFRVGAEIRLADMFLVRAGYNYTSCPEKHYSDQFGNDVNSSNFNVADYDAGRIALSNMKYYDSGKWSVSAGLGYDALGMFFVDLGVKMTNCPITYFFPYYDYQNYDKNGIEVDVVSPKIRVERKLWNVALTFGWRF